MLYVCHELLDFVLLFYPRKIKCISSIDYWSERNMAWFSLHSALEAKKKTNQKKNKRREKKNVNIFWWHTLKRISKIYPKCKAAWNLLSFMLAETMYWLLSIIRRRNTKSVNRQKYYTIIRQCLEFYRFVSILPYGMEQLFQIALCNFANLYILLHLYIRGCVCDAMI